LFDTGNGVDAVGSAGGIPGLRKATLRCFTRLLAGDLATATAFVKAGVAAERVRTVGVLEQIVEVPPCLEAERDTLAELTAARPIWLAAEVASEEFDAVLTAHAAAMRRAHRLLLIAVPAELRDTESLTDAVVERGLSYQMRSAGEEPGAETQVYIADTEDEMGLWYRLAPATFLGRTLFDGGRPGPHPFHAAGLGSVILHGPQTAHHRDAFRRLKLAGASREVADAQGLSAGLENLLSPDKAAEMAHAAWQVCSAGSEVADIAIDMVLDQVVRTKSVK
jgi:3-deoxy-D-manno-octulosonic-acid transferase